MSRRAWVRQIMGMPVSLHLRGSGVETAAVEAAVRSAFGVLEEADRVFSTYRDDSEISRIRRGELTLPEAGPLVRQVRRWCDRAAELTDGAFTAWLPDARGVVGFDPTGLVKGWATERAARRLARSQPYAYCLNVGGDVAVDSRRDVGGGVAGGRRDVGWDVAVDSRRDVGGCVAGGRDVGGDVAVDSRPDLGGSAPGGRPDVGGTKGRPGSGPDAVGLADGVVPWRVGIEDPMDRSRIAYVLDVDRGGVATSGSAARGAHLYDPIARRFVDRPGSVTVSGPSLMWADVWATAVFVGPVGIERLLAERAPGYRLIRL